MITAVINISPNGLDFPIHGSGPLAWIGKSKPLGEITLEKIRKSMYYFSIVKFSIPNWNDQSKYPRLDLTEKTETNMSLCKNLVKI